MNFPYRFIALDAEQESRRRYLLDSYGQFAQLSVLLIPLLYQLFHGFRLLAGRLRRQSQYRPVKDHQSPIVSNFKQSEAVLPSNLWARFEWALNDEIAEGWGTRQEWLIAGLWTVWLLVLAVKNTGDDYLHLTKRFGIIAASQLPIHYLLAFKAWSPIQYLTRLSHEELNPYHRLLGRIITTFFSLHASMYLNFYIQKGLLQERIRDWDVILGLTAITTALFINTTALAKIRTWNYRLFFYLHVLLSLTLLPTLYLHVTHLRIYILEATTLYILLTIQRNISQSPATATITPIPHTTLLSITIPLTTSLAQKTYTPGQHIYLGFPSLPQKLRINPFTIANPDPEISTHLQLIARTLTGSTALLAKSAHTPTPILIEGPYGSSRHFPQLDTYDRILLIAGGVGATFTLPSFINFLQRAKAEGGSASRIRFVWAVREVEDAGWGVQLLRQHSVGLEGMEVFVSRSRTEGEDEQEGVELFPREGFKERVEGLADVVREGRPDLKAVVDETFAKNVNDSVAVLVCGPQGMGRSLRNSVGKWVGRGREVFWHSEEFGW